MHRIKTVCPVCSNCGAIISTLFAICPVCDCELEVELKVVYKEKCKKCKRCGFEHEESEMCRKAESYFPGDGLIGYKDGVYIEPMLKDTTN